MVTAAKPKPTLRVLILGTAVKPKHYTCPSAAFLFKVYVWFQKHYEIVLWYAKGFFAENKLPFQKLMILENVTLLYTSTETSALLYAFPKRITPYWKVGCASLPVVNIFQKIDILNTSQFREDIDWFKRAFNKILYMCFPHIPLIYEHSSLLDLSYSLQSFAVSFASNIQSRTIPNTKRNTN